MGVFWPYVILWGCFGQGCFGGGLLGAHREFPPPVGLQLHRSNPANCVSGRESNPGPPHFWGSSLTITPTRRRQEYPVILSQQEPGVWTSNNSQKITVLWNNWPDQCSFLKNIFSVRSQWRVLCINVWVRWRIGLWPPLMRYRWVMLCQWHYVFVRLWH